MCKDSISKNLRAQINKVKCKTQMCDKTSHMMIYLVRGHILTSITNPSPHIVPLFKPAPFENGIGSSKDDADLPLKRKDPFFNPVYSYL